jgi:uncharacterized membrane protein YphA (DoxX/SURF4 family)
MKKQLSVLFTVVRIVVGWAFLYEGISKLMMSEWSSTPYLSESRWIFASLFQWMSQNPGVIAVVDFLYIWGLILVGLGLILGLLTRWVSIGGALMLLFYFVVYTPVPGYLINAPVEGGYLWINQELIESCMLIALAFLPVTVMYGLDRLIAQWKAEKARQPIPDSPENRERRAVLKQFIGVPVLGVFAYALYKKKQWDSFEEKLLKIEGIDPNLSRSMVDFNFDTLRHLKGQVPHVSIDYLDKDGQPAKFELSRLLLGGNLMGGHVHARDLIYVSRLVKRYHTDEKVVQTLALSEKCGVNAIIANPQQGRIFQIYRHEFKGKMKFISDCGIDLNFKKGIDMSLASDFDALYCQGEITDRWADENWNDREGRTFTQRMELIRQGLDEIRSHGKPAGIGAHKIEAVKACVEYGLKPDFWVKTCHNHDYWSAQHERRYDSYFDYDPEETIRYMATLDAPWIAFKVLAAGAIKPEVGLEYAYRNGADFVCLGMYDFQIVEDVNIALDTLEKTKVRPRKWHG